MRLFFSSLDRPKAAAKLMVRSAGHVKLNQAQAAIAGSIGYRDWHDLADCTKRHVENETDSAVDRKQIILSICDRLEMSWEDVQYALSKSRLFGNLTLEEGLKTRVEIWRDRVFGPPKRGRLGTVVKIKSPGFKEPGYLVGAGRPSRVLFDATFGHCADFEVQTPRVPLPDFAPSRLWLPYGYWTLRDRSKVTFSRDYKPMWRSLDGQNQRLDPWLWIREIGDEKHFCSLAGTPEWSGGRARALALAHLSEHRLFELPRLLDAMPLLFDPKVDSIEDAVKRMQDATVALAA